MRCTYQLLLLAAASQVSRAADGPRPRGVGPDFAKFFKAKDSFACIHNPSITLASSQVNDDYCDCPDGSDEPGTSACSNLSPLSPRLASDVEVPGTNTTLALPGFYCKNKGHHPSYLPFENVNDGVCDYELCCDGSDEWDRVGGASCPDRCKEIGKEWRAKDEARQKSMTAALKKRLELVTEAARLKKEVEDRVESLTVEVQSQEIKVKNLEARVAEVERKARSKVVKAPAAGGKLGVLAELARAKIDELREHLVDVRLQRDSSLERVKELETILTTFKEEYNPNFNDEGVKRAVRSWEDYAAKERADEATDEDEQDLEEVLKPDSDTEGINWAEFEAEESKSELELLYDFEAYLPPTLRTWVDSKLRDLRVFLIDNGVVAGTHSTSDAVAPEVAAARAELQSAQSVLTTQQNDLSSHQEDAGKDYGPDSVFRALKGRCVSKDSGEYTYELCWLDRTKQRSKKGGSETNMGNFASIESVTVDDALPADGKGLGSGRRLALRHDGGQHCWNGPHRSTLVVLACAEADEIWKIVEEEKCVYRMEVGTPAACEAGQARKAAAAEAAAAKKKDEL